MSVKPTPGSSLCGETPFMVVGLAAGWTLLRTGDREEFPLWLALVAGLVLSVAGFDDSPMARHAWPPLTTVRQPIAEVARLATEELMKLLQGRSEVGSHQCLRAGLVLRSSTASPALARG